MKQATKKHDNSSELRLSEGLEAKEKQKPTKQAIVKRLRALAEDMDEVSAMMGYYGGFAEWAQHGQEIAGAGAIARQWADEIEVSN